MLNTISFTLSISRFHMFFHSSSHGRFGRHVHLAPGQCFWAARRKCLWRIGGANWREVQLGDTESVNGMVCHHLCSEDVCWIEWFWSDGDWPCVTFTTMESSHGLLLLKHAHFSRYFLNKEHHIVVFHANQEMKFFPTWRVFGTFISHSYFYLVLLSAM